MELVGMLKVWFRAKGNVKVMCQDHVTMALYKTCQFDGLK